MLSVSTVLATSEIYCQQVDKGESLGDARRMGTIYRNSTRTDSIGNKEKHNCLLPLRNFSDPWCGRGVGPADRWPPGWVKERIHMVVDGIILGMTGFSMEWVEDCVGMVAPLRSLVKQDQRTWSRRSCRELLRQTFQIAPSLSTHT